MKKLIIHLFFILLILLLYLASSRMDYKGQKKSAFAETSAVSEALIYLSRSALYSRCDYNEQCQRDIPGTICAENGVCECAAGFIESNKQCMPMRQCEPDREKSRSQETTNFNEIDPEQGSCRANERCLPTLGLCICKEGYEWAFRDGDSACELAESKMNKMISGTDPLWQEAVCPLGYVKVFRQCLPMVGLLQNCRNSRQCNANVPFSYCGENRTEIEFDFEHAQKVCQCIDGYAPTWDNLYCVPLKKCPSPQKCNEDEYCRKKFCECRPDRARNHRGYCSIDILIKHFDQTLDQAFARHFNRSKHLSIVEHFLKQAFGEENNLFDKYEKKMLSKNSIPTLLQITTFVLLSLVVILFVAAMGLCALICLTYTRKLKKFSSSCEYKNLTDTDIVVS